MEIKFQICEKVYYFNTAECRVMSAEVKGVQVVPTGISKDEKGENVLDGVVVLYQTFEGPVLSEQECFRSEEECLAWYKEYFKHGGWDCQMTSILEVYEDTEDTASDKTGLH